MDPIIRQITEQLVNLLPDDNQYYRLDKLPEWGFPVFIIRRIRVELERNLAESMILPETDWADVQSEAVQNVWKQFINVIRAEARLPASYARPVLETAVAEVMEILIQPRKNLPGAIFGADTELDLDELGRRLDSVPVYRHFPELIDRYVRKKELVSFTADRCRMVIEKADEKWTAHYTPLNWAQLLDPLFILTKGEADPNLFRLFFEDKQRPKLARLFEQVQGPLNRAALIELLSSPQSLEPETAWEEADGKELVGREPDSMKPGGRDLRGSEPDSMKPDGNESGSMQPDGVKSGSIESGSKEPGSMKSDSKEAGSQKPGGKPAVTEGSNGSTADSGPAPMWQRFMSPEDIARLNEDEEIEESEHGRLIDQLFQPVPGGNKTEDVAVEALRSSLKSRKKFYIKYLFRGSAPAYEAMITEIAGKKNWQQASRFIAEEVFKRNMVDIYSEAAVEFTDRLQSYFEKINL